MAVHLNRQLRGEVALDATCGPLSDSGRPSNPNETQMSMVVRAWEAMPAPVRVLHSMLFRSHVQLHIYKAHLVSNAAALSAALLASGVVQAEEAQPVMQVGACEL